jgi:arylsulfatase A-like enzyme
VTVDTVRADHLSVYGYERATSPRIDGLAARGVVFETVIAPAPETQPACASLLTGRWPADLGVRGNAQKLAPDALSLAEVLAGAGYTTAGFVSGYPLIRELSGLEQGFTVFDDHLPDPRGKVEGVQRAAEKTTAAVLRWLDTHGNEPSFLWVHYYDPHGDYSPGPDYETLFQDGARGPDVPLAQIPAYQRLGGETDAAVFVRRYDGEIRRVDTELGRLLDALEARGLTDRTLVAVVADHGESLTEHGYFFDHGNELYLPSVRIPLVLAGPGVPTGGRRIGGLVRTPDVMPTLLELLGVPVPESVRGISVRSTIDTGEPTGREGLSEARFARYEALTAGSDVSPKLSVRDDRYTVILRFGSATAELYDRLQDPGETDDLFRDAAGPEVDSLRLDLAHSFRTHLEALGSGATEPPTILTPAMRARLDTLANRSPAGRQGNRGS